MKIDELITPAALVDGSVLRRNIERMAELCARIGVQLRPHVKSHNYPEIAKMQMAAGAKGITVATLREAELMIQSGIKDIFIAREIVDFAGLRRLAELTKSARMNVAVDSAEGVRRLSQIMTEAQTRVGVLIEIDTGGRRCGISSDDEICALARLAKNSAGIEWRGIFTHEGHVYSASSREEMMKISAEVVGRMSELCGILTEKQMAPQVVSIGSSPSLKLLSGRQAVTEARPGNYVFNDAMQLANGSARLEDCALKVMATVISKSGQDRVVLNVGSKLLGSDRGNKISDSGGYGLVCDPLPGGVRDLSLRSDCAKGEAGGGFAADASRITKIYEEHAVLAEGIEKLAVGQNVIFIPSHACMAANLAREVYLTDAAGNVIDCWSNRKMQNVE